MSARTESERGVSSLWVFVPDLSEAGVYVLAADEARHVMARRLRVGDGLVLFDGAGRTAAARVEAIKKKAVEVVADSVQVAPLHATLPAPSPSRSSSVVPAAGCVLATAIPKGDRLSTMLQMLTQLGVTHWQPLILQDSAVRALDPEAKRLRRILVESAKVARRPWLLTIARPRDLRAVLDEYADSDAGSIYFGDREGRADGLAPGARLVLIGPEAGFSEAERDLIQSKGALPCAFSPHNLRVEVAAVGAAVALNLASASGENSRNG